MSDFLIGFALIAFGVSGIFFILVIVDYFIPKWKKRKRNANHQ